ncbi:helix-turn-helix domain-containing protein [Roseovarius ramblicola]|uniref:Helix-turn-helix domain-containing protein n=1 Tax=Roseovarius ramblicola TaxID=2022336 RepID=A0ABV5HZ57_9RHOB
MSNVAAGLVQRRRTGGPSTKAVLTFMATCASDDGSGIWTSKTNMAADLEMSKRTVQRAVQDLCDAGLVSECGRKKCRNGYTVEYRIDLAAVEKLPLTREEKAGNQPGSTGDTVTPVRSPDTTSRGDTLSPVTPCHPTGDTVTPQGVTQCHPNSTGIVPESIAAVPAAQQLDMGGGDDPDIPDIVARFLAAYPRAGDAGKVEAGLRAAIASGVDPETVIAAARAHAHEQKGNAQRYIAYPENWLDRRGWERHTARLQNTGHDPDARLRSAAELIESGNPALCRHVTAVTARELLHRGMVTAEQCRAAEVQP